MKKAIVFSAACFAALAVGTARADDFSFSFNGPSVDKSNQFSFSGSGTIAATYTGFADVWTINSISGSVTTETYEGKHTPIDTATYTIGSLLPAYPATGNFDQNDNLLFWPGGLSLSGADYFDSNGVSFSLLGSADDINLDTAYVFWVLPYDQGNDAGYSEPISETVCWQDPGVTPTPEPGSLALLATSILGGAGLLRRRFRA